VGDLDDQRSRAYYDAFAERYDARRGGNEPNGYHDLIDDLEVEMVERFGVGGDVLEVGCGTGLLLGRFARFAKTARGIDSSPGMLARAEARGLDVALASATALPFPDASFDVTCSFKVLAHVREVELALREMFRVTRPGGVVVAEFYNTWSLRSLARRLGGPRAVSERIDESEVFVRLDDVDTMHGRFPRDARFLGARGIRIVTPAAGVLRWPFLGGALARAERALADTALGRFGGFYVLAYRKG
jgi:ubiquinone/menaquinone biosynthesis C-methylase UbiE